MRTLCLACISVIAMGTPLGSSDARTITIADLLSLKDVAFLSLSPDGSQLAYEVGEEIFAVATRKGSAPRSLGPGIMPLWSTSGRYLAFYSQETGSRQLFMIDVKGGRRVQITSLAGGIDPNPVTRFNGWVGDPLRFAWSPDDQNLVFASQVTPSAPLSSAEANGAASARRQVLVLNSTTPETWTLAGLMPGLPSIFADLPAPTANELFVANVPARTVRRLTHDGRQYFNPDWSPDGRSIVCGSSEGRPWDGFGSVASNIYVIDLETGKGRGLTWSLEGSRRLPSWSPDGRAVAFIETPAYMRGLDVVSVVASTGGATRPASVGLHRPVKSFAWNADSRAIVFPVTDGVTGWIGRSMIASGATTRVAEARTQSWTFSASKTGVLAWEDGDATHEGLIRVWSPENGVAETLVDVNPHLREFAVGTQTVLRWQNSRGEELDGLVITPPGHEPGRRYPMVVDAYGWQRDRLRSGIIANPTLAAKGYVVFLPNYRAPHMAANYMKDAAHHDAGRGPQGGDLLLDDVMSGIDTLVRTGVADPNRIGLHGYSNGATAAMYLLTRTGRFAAAATAAGMADWLRGFFLSSQDTTLPALLEGRTPWTDLKAYTDLSVPYHLDRITTPLLLAVGDRDHGRVLDHVFMYNGLRRLGRTVVLIRYRDERHLLSRWALEDYWERVFAWFDLHLRVR